MRRSLAAARSARPTCRGRAAPPRRRSCERRAGGVLDPLAASGCPGRSSTGRPVEQSTIADSMPMRAAPPSSTGSGLAELVGTCAARGRADPAEAVRARRGDAGHAGARAPRASNACATGCAGQRRPIVAWPAAAASAPPGWRRTITVSGPGQNASTMRSATGRDHAESLGAGTVGDVDDQRVPGGPALQREDLRDRRVVVGARAEAVDGLGGKGDELARGEARRRVGHGGGIETVEPHPHLPAGDAEDRRRFPGRGFGGRSGSGGEGQMTHLAARPRLALP